MTSKAPWSNLQTATTGSVTGRLSGFNPQPHSLPSFLGSQAKSHAYLLRDGILVDTYSSAWGTPSLLQFSYALPGDRLLILPLGEPPRLYRGKGSPLKPRSWRRLNDPELIKQTRLLLLLQP